MNDPRGMANDPIWRAINMPKALPDPGWRETLVRTQQAERQTADARRVSLGLRGDKQGLRGDRARLDALRGLRSRVQTIDRRRSTDSMNETAAYEAGLVADYKAAHAPPPETWRYGTAVSDICRGTRHSRFHSLL